MPSKFCEQCKTEGTIPRTPSCDNCNNLGYVIKCRTCKGKGSWERDCDCPNCMGDCMDECYDCDGFGTEPVEADEPGATLCETCEGIVVMSCPGCLGAGVVTEEGLPLPRLRKQD